MGELSPPPVLAPLPPPLPAPLVTPGLHKPPRNCARANCKPNFVHPLVCYLPSNYLNVPAPPGCSIAQLLRRQGGRVQRNQRSKSRHNWASLLGFANCRPPCIGPEKPRPLFILAHVSDISCGRGRAGMRRRRIPPQCSTGSDAMGRISRKYHCTNAAKLPHQVCFQAANINRPQRQSQGIAHRSSTETPTREVRRL